MTTEVTDAINTATRERLKGFIERIEKVEEEEADLKAGKKEIYSELKGEGFDSKAVRRIIRLRRKNKAEVEQEEAVVELYLDAIGGL